ncbi:MAG: proline dehydrogenase [Caeruleum heppii]|nr:MAG: proline dehydrogenase [Caeruleum heppii]
MSSIFSAPAKRRIALVLSSRSCLSQTSSVDHLLITTPFASRAASTRWSTRHNSSISPAHTARPVTADSLVVTSSQSITSTTHDSRRPPPLSILPLTVLIRSLAINSISSSRLLLTPSMAIMHRLAYATSPLLKPDTNPPLRWLLKRVFYAQFCAGENAAEVDHTVAGLKKMGYRGVILNYAKEIELDREQVKKLDLVDETKRSEVEAVRRKAERDVESWKKGTLETVRLTGENDMVAVKFSGAGILALHALRKQIAPPACLESAIDEICDYALSRKVRLLFDAEQAALQPGVDSWTLDYMRRFNNRVPDQAIVYGTYQAYLKATPAKLAAHMAIAAQEGFTVGVKLVRGAYLGSDPRHFINDTKEITDEFFDGIMESLLKRTWNSVLKPVDGQQTKYPAVNLVLASHNHLSVRKALAIRDAQARSGEPMIDTTYAQLMGMADEVSCDILQAGRDREGNEMTEVPRAYKYIAWGTTSECMKYLHRRAEENRDAVDRTREGRDALAAEMMRRLRGWFGFA